MCFTYDLFNSLLEPSPRCGVMFGEGHMGLNDLDLGPYEDEDNHPCEMEYEVSNSHIKAHSNTLRSAV